MDRFTISPSHTLKLIPLDRIVSYTRVHSRVMIDTLGEPDDAGAVPGSVKVSNMAEKGRNRKRITYERSDVSEIEATRLEGYKSKRLVATYTDESGRRRVVGSPDWPLTLDYTTEEGVFSVTLEGEDLRPDGFLVD